MNHKIVVVDDEILIQRILAEELTDAGYQVELASSGEEVLKILHGTSIDLIISDIQMPYMTGMQLLRKVQESFSMPPPMILVSAFSDTVREEAYALGAQGVFAKPIDFTELLNAIERRLMSVRDQYRRPAALSAVEIAVKESFGSLKTAQIDHKFGLGLGGFFLSIAGPLPRIDTEIGYALQFDQDRCSLEGRGIVRWVRHLKASSYPAGIGVEILDLQDASLECFMKWREEASTAFIPID